MKPRARFVRSAGDSYSIQPVRSAPLPSRLTGPSVRSIPISAGSDAAVDHYMDESLAASILTRIAPVVTPDPATGLVPDGGLGGAPYVDQLAATKGLFATVGAYYKAVNVRPQSDPLFVRWWIDWFGKSIVPSILLEQSIAAGTSNFQNVLFIPNAATAGNDIKADPAWAADNGIGTTVMFAPQRCIFNTRILNAWTLLHKDPPDADHPLYCDVIIRVQLNQNGDVLTLYPNGPDANRIVGPPGSLGDFNRGTLYIGCAQDGSSAENCGPFDPRVPYNWNTFMWNDPPTPPGSVRGLCRINRALVPMKWFYDAAVDLLQRILARTSDYTPSIPIGTVSDAIQYSTLWNLYIGHRYHLLPDELEVYAANLPDMESLAQIQNRQANAAVVHQTLGTMARLSGNPYAQAYASFMEAIVSILPAAVAVEVDFFGRELPFALKVDIQRTPAQLAPIDPSGRYAAILSRPRPTVVKPDTGKTSLVKPFAIAALAVVAWKLLPLLGK